MATNTSIRSPWSWIPTLYFAEGMPYVVVMTVAVIMFKKLGISNTDIALYTSWLYFPWVFKPIWSPLVDILKSKRWWIVSMQILIGAALAGIALCLPGPEAFRYCLAFMWLLAFSSATHDIAADGFYMLALDEKKRRAATIIIGGVLLAAFLAVFLLPGVRMIFYHVFIPLSVFLSSSIRTSHIFVYS
mgnify:CR=1 FL=1